VPVGQSHVDSREHLILFFVTSLIGPLSNNLTAFLVLSCLAGIGSGTFIPLTIAFVIRYLPALVYGIAIYAMNSKLSQNVAASLEGWYVNHFSWQWVYWQYCVALPFMFVAIWFGVPRERINVSTVLIGIACVMASNLTPDWATDDFLPLQILQAIGQSFALTALIVLVARSIVPAKALTIGCLLQLSRLFGGESEPRSCRPSSVSASRCIPT
jgi:MFS family permease